MPRPQEEETVVINHHTCNREPQEYPEAEMVTMRMKVRRKEDGMRDPQGEVKDRKRMRRRRKRPLRMNYGSPEP